MLSNGLAHQLYELTPPLTIILDPPLVADLLDVCLWAKQAGDGIHFYLLMMKARDGTLFLKSNVIFLHRTNKISITNAIVAIDSPIPRARNTPNI